MIHSVLYRIKTIAIGLDVFVNACIGGAPYQTISCRVGLSILAGRWASRVAWPSALRNHFLDSIFDAVV